MHRALQFATIGRTVRKQDMTDVSYNIIIGVQLIIITRVEMWDFQLGKNAYYALLISFFFKLLLFNVNG